MVALVQGGVSNAARARKFFLRESDVGKPRAAATLPRLAELNAYVPVKDLGGSPGQDITVDLIQGFQVNGSWLYAVVIEQKARL